MLKEFKSFAIRGNIVDLAIGIIIGSAFNAIVSSLVADIFMPIIGILTGGLDFSDLSYTVGNATIAYGKFIQAVFIFLITVFGLFLIVKGINALRKKEKAEPKTPETLPLEVQLLTEIRDLLRNRS